MTQINVFTTAALHWGWLASNEYSLLYFRLSDGQKISSTWLQICGDNIDIMHMQ